MRAVAGWLASALVGAGVAVLGALASHGWSARDLPAGMPRRYVDYLPLETDWAALLVPAALTGAVLGLVVAAIVRLAGPRSRTVAVLGSGLAGAVVAALGVLTSHLWLRRDDGGYHGYYSPLPNATNQRPAYASDLTVTVDTDWTALLLPAALTGAVLGLLVLLVSWLIRRRSPGQVDGA